MMSTFQLLLSTRCQHCDSTKTSEIPQFWHNLCKLVAAVPKRLMSLEFVSFSTFPTRHFACNVCDRCRTMSFACFRFSCCIILSLLTAVIEYTVKVYFPNREFTITWVSDNCHSLTGTRWRQPACKIRSALSKNTSGYGQIPEVQKLDPAWIVCVLAWIMLRKFKLAELLNGLAKSAKHGNLTR